MQELVTRLKTRRPECAELPNHDGPVDQTAVQQMRLRLPDLSGLVSVIGSGLSLSVADRDIALAAPGASRPGPYDMMIDGKCAPHLE